jgi:hypothetical protein
MSNKDKYWSEYTVVNISGIETSTIRTVLITGYFTGFPRGFVYHNKYYHGVAIENKFDAIRFVKMRVPDNTMIDFDDQVKAIPTNELVCVCPLNHEVASTIEITYDTGFTAKFLKFG